MGSGGLLKFSGLVSATVAGLVDNFLADTGAGAGLTSILVIAPSYPVAVVHSLRNFATNVSLILPGTALPGMTITVERNGVALPGYLINYTAGEGGAGALGVKSIVVPPVLLAIGDRIDVRVNSAGFDALGIPVSATIGIE